MSELLHLTFGHAAHTRVHQTLQKVEPESGVDPLIFLQSLLDSGKTENVHRARYLFAPPSARETETDRLTERARERERERQKQADRQSEREK